MYPGEATATRGGRKLRASTGSTIVSALLSIYFSGCLILGRKVNFTGDIKDIFPANLIAPLTWADIALIVGVAIAIFLLFILGGPRLGHALEMRLERGETVRRQLLWVYCKEHRLKIALMVAILFTCWFLVLLNFYPGTSMNDQLYIIDRPIEMSIQHPLLYNLLLAGCVRGSVALFNDGNIGFFVFVIIQMLVCAGIVTIIIVWLRWRKASRGLCIAIFATFALLPIIQNFTMSTIKDSYFSFFVLLWIPFLYEYSARGDDFWDSRHHCIIFFVLCLATALLRNNGRYIVYVLMLYFILSSIRRPGFRQLLITSAIAVVICMTPNIIVSHVTHDEQLFQEKVAIPIQQLSATISENGETTPAEQHFLDNVFVRHRVADAYAPMYVDSIKYDGSRFDSDYLQDHQMEFMKTWVDVGLKNPSIYLRAYLSLTYGYWDFFSASNEQTCFFEISGNLHSDDTERLKNLYRLHNESLYPEGVSEAITEFYGVAVHWCPGAGGCFAIVLLLGLAICFKNRTARYYTVLLPCFFLWGTLMVSVPISGALRYVFTFVLSIPVLLGILFIPEKAGDHHAR